MARSTRDNTRRIYVGNLPEDVRKSELEDLFGKYGSVVGVDIFSRKSPPFAFVEFKKEKDAEDAVENMDRRRWGDTRLRVEHPKGYEQRRRRSPSPRGFRVRVSNLPRSTSWQDLKDHLKRAGSITFADVNRDGTGFVDFLRRDDMEYAVKHYDDTEIKTYRGDYGYIRIQSERSRRRSYTRSRSSSRDSRSRSRSLRRDSRSRSRSSRRDSRSRSPSSRRDSRARSPSSRSDSRSRSPSSRRDSRSRSPSSRRDSRARSPSSRRDSRARSPSSRSDSRSRSPSSRSDSRSKSRSSHRDSRSRTRSQPTSNSKSMPHLPTKSSRRSSSELEAPAKRARLESTSDSEIKV